ncbi:hypothetical protein AMECASPLE_026765, partial [Ameca splendens]
MGESTPVFKLEFSSCNIQSFSLTGSVYSLPGSVNATRRLHCVCYLIDCLLCSCIYHIVCMYSSVRCSHDCYLIRGVCVSVCGSQQPTPPHTVRSAKPSPTLHPSFHSSNEK